MSNPIEIDCRTVEQKLRSKEPGFVLVDCREQDEFDLVRIEGATLCR